MSMRLIKAVTIASLIAAMNVPVPPAAAFVAPQNVATRDGCANYWMFNGVWRVQVTGTAPHMDSGKQIGWDVTEVWRNGTTQTISPGDSVEWSQRLVLQNGQVVNAEDTTTGSLSQQTVDFHQFPPSAQYTQTQAFIAPNVDPNNKPAAIIISFDAAKLHQYPARPQFSVNPPNYRIKFECTPDEVAKAAAAQGGSVQVAAHEGCLNEWLSNGLWRVRVSNLAPFLHDNNQVGWQLTEDWVNLTGRNNVSPGFTSMQDQQLALKNGDTVSSGNSTITTLTSQQLGFHNFTPGGSFTYTQPFWPNPPFDASNTPGKLLIMFDAKHQAANVGAPQFHGPGNIRISLSCTK